jgi:putative hemolysin
MTFNLRVALLGLLTLSAGFSLAGCTNDKCCGDKACAEQCQETKISVADLPPAVVATINREAPGGRNVEAEKCEMKGGTCYCVEVEHTGEEWEFCVLADGTLEKKERE